MPAVLLVCLLVGGQAAAAGSLKPGGEFGSGGGSSASASYSGGSATGQGTASGASASDHYRNSTGFFNANGDDLAPPRVTEVASTTADGLYGPGSAIEVKVSFTEPVSSSGLTIGLNSGGSVRTGAFSGVTSCSGTYTIGPGQAAPRLNAVAIAGTITDATHNTVVDPAVPAGRNIADFGGIAIDTAGPAIAISLPSAPVTAAGPVTYTVSYTDANFGASTLAPATVALNRTGTADGTVGVTGTGPTRTVTISGTRGTGTLGISLAAGTAVDLAGNSAPAAGPGAPFAVDNTPPAVLGANSGSENGQYRAGSAIALTLGFSEKVSSTGLKIHLNSGGTVSTGPFGAATSWSGTATVGAGQGTADLSVASISGTITDERGHETIDPAVPAGRNIADARAIVIDTTAPSVTIGPPSAVSTRAGPVAYTVAYTDANFSASTLAGAAVTLNKTGTADGVVAVTGAGAARTVTVSGISGNGTLGIAVAAGTATDVAGNQAPAAGPGAAFQVDNTPPQVTSVGSTTPQGHYKTGGVINVTVNFSEPVYAAGLTIKLNSGGSVTTGALNGVAHCSGNYTVAAGQSAASLSVDTITGKITDAAGNPMIDTSVPAGRNIADSNPIVVDTLGPVIALGAPSPAVTRTGPVTYSVTYQDPFFAYSTLTAADVRLNKTGSADGTVALAGTGDTQTLTIDHVAGDGTLSIALAPGTATDLAGNAAAAGSSQAVQVDNSPPRVTSAASSTADGHYAAGSEIVVTVNFSEAVVSPGLTLTLNSGGSVSTGALAGVAHYSGTYAVGPGQAAADLSIVAISGTITDRVGNASTDPRVPAGKNIADAKAIVVDTTAPTVSIGTPSAAATKAGPVTYAVTYADANFGRSTLASGDITLHKTGTADGTVVVSGAKGARTVEIRNASGNGTLGISVAAGTAADLAGNRAPAAAHAATFQVDNTPPAVTGATSATADGYYKAGSSIDVTLNFSKAVSSTGLTLKLDAGGTVSTGAFNGVTSCSGTYSVAAAQTAADLSVVSITGTIADALGNKAVNPAVPAGQNIADGKRIVIDTTAPSVSIGAPSLSATKTGPVSYPVSYADTNLNSSALAPAQVTLVKTGNADGAVSVAGSGSAWTVTITPTAGSGTLGIAVAAGTAADLAGNSAPAPGPSRPFQVDNTPPAVTGVNSTTPNGHYKAGSPISLTVSFSEPVSSPGLTLNLNSGGTASTGALSGATTCTAVSLVEDGQTSPDLSVSSITGSISDAVTNATVDPVVPAGRNIADSKAIVADTTAPAVAIGAPSAAASRTGPVRYGVSYADANFGASTLAPGDITLNATGTATGRIGVAGTAAARTVTISDVTGDGTLGIALAAGTGSDVAGNRARAAGPSASFVADNTPPALTGANSTAAEGHYRAGSAIDVTLTFSEPVSSTGLSITLNSGGTVRTGALNAVTSHRGTYTVGAGQSSADLDISAVTGTISDAAGNTAVDPPVPAGRNIADTSSIAIDTTAPTVAIGAPSAAATKAGPVTFTVTCADKDIKTGKVGSGDVTLNRSGTANGVVEVSGSDTSWTVTIGSTTGTGTLGIALAAGVATDSAGNRSPATGPSATFVVDNTPPAVAGATAAAADGHFKAGSLIDVTVNFTEAVSSTGLTLTLNSGGTVSTGAFSGATTGRGRYTVAAGQTAADLSVVAIKGTIADAAANETTDPAVPEGMNLADAKAIVIDTAAPTVAIGPPSAVLIKAGPALYTITYADANFGAGTLAAGDVTLNRTGSATGTVEVAGTGTTRTVTISGAAGDGTLGITLAAGTARDQAGNLAPAAGPSATVTVDNARPTVTIGASVAAASEAGTAAGQFTVGRAGSTNFDLEVNYRITGTADAGDYGALSGSVTIPAGAATQTITVTPVDDSAVEGDETVIATLVAGAAYLVGTPASATVTIRSDDGSFPPTVGTLAPLPLTTQVGRVQTFTAVYSDQDGAANLQRVDFRVYLSSPATYLSLGYDRAANTVNLYDESGTAAVGSCSPGTAVTLSNKLGAVDCAATAAGVSGNDLTVRWSIAPSVASAAQLQVRATDVTGRAVGWTTKGAWTIIPTNQAPTLVSVVPAALTSPPHAAQTFSAVYADADGFANLRTAALLVNATEHPANGIRLSYDRLANRLSLYDDAGTATLGSCTPQENKNLSNAQATLSCAATTVNATGDQLTVNWSIAPKSAFVASTPWNLYLQAGDLSAADTVWTDLGDWTVTSKNLPPTPESVTPAVSMSTFGTAQTFSAVYSDPDGVANLRTVSLLANARPTAEGGILVQYDRTTNRLFLSGESAASASDWCTPGQAKSLPLPRQARLNSPGSLNCASTTVSDSGKELRVAWNITPSAAFASAAWRNLYLGARDLSDRRAPWTDRGDWLLTGETPTTGTVSPAALVSAPDSAQTFAAVYRDPRGYLNVKQASLLVNSAASAANGIRVSYDGQWLRLSNDAGGDFVGFCQPGEAGSLSNTQGTLDCAATTVSGSGNDLMVKWTITPSAAFASASNKNIYLDPLDPAHADIGWVDAGDWTVVATAAAQPAALTVTPAALTSAAATPRLLTSACWGSQTISTVYTAANGVANLRSASFLLNATPTASNGIALVYDRTANRLSLRNDADTGTVGSCTPGANVHFRNSQGQLSCPSTTVAVSGNDLTVDWNIMPLPAFTSDTTPKNLYLSASDPSNASVEWTDRGDWLIKKTNAPPTLGSLTPSATENRHSVPQSFTAVYRDADGFANVWYADFLVNVSPVVVYSIRVRYDRTVNRLYLYGDMGNSYSDGCTPGEIKSVSNSQGTLNCASTTVASSGTDLTVTWDITPRASFSSAPLSLYLDATDMSHQSLEWTRLGTWTVTNAPPTLGSVAHTPATSAPAEAHSFTTAYSDANGAADLKSVKFLVNTTANPKDGICVRYDSTGELSLYDDTGAAAVGSCRLGQAHTLSNARGSLNCAATTVESSGSALTVTWNITPSPDFASGGPRNLYLSAVDVSNASAGWTLKGDWTIKNAAPAAATAALLPASAHSGCTWLAPDPTHRLACVDSAAALAACLLEAETDGRHDEIRIVQGYYRGSFAFAQDEDYDLALVGGYRAKCAERSLDPALTVLDADFDGDGTGDGRVLEIDADLRTAQLQVARITARNGVAAAGEGGCIMLLTGGGAVLDGVELAGCRAAGAGGAAAVEVGSGAALVRGSILRGSSAASGGGLAVRSTEGKVLLINNTISGNAAQIGGGLLIEGEPDGVLEFSNNIVWGNSAGISGDVTVAGYADPARVTMGGNDFAKMTAPETWPAPDESNINADPGFASREDLHLTQASPCRDAGVGTDPMAGAVDIDGDERRIGATIDIGADEYGPAR